MTEITTLASYDPHSQDQYDALHSRFRVQFYAALRQRDPKIRREIKNDMRKTRLSSYQKPSDYAALFLEKIRYRAMRRGIYNVHLPRAESFRTLRELLNFAADSERWVQDHVCRMPIVAEIARQAGAMLRRGGNIMTINPGAAPDIQPGLPKP